LHVGFARRGRDHADVKLRHDARQHEQDHHAHGQHHSGALRLGHLQIAQVSVDVDTNTTNNSSTASITVHYPDVSVSKSGELAVHCRQCGQLQHHGDGAGSGNSTNVTLSDAPPPATPGRSAGRMFDILFSLVQRSRA
jgi:hypothetical protein